MKWFDFMDLNFFGPALNLKDLWLLNMERLTVDMMICRQHFKIVTNCHNITNSQQHHNLTNMTLAYCEAKKFTRIETALMISFDPIVKDSLSTGTSVAPNSPPLIASYLSLTKRSFLF